MPNWAVQLLCLGIPALVKAISQAVERSRNRKAAKRDASKMAEIRKIREQHLGTGQHE